MNILLAKTAGFCYGVRRAVEMARKAAQDGPVYLLGSITHNDHVIRQLEELGAVTVAAPQEVPEGARVLIRAHGEPDSTYAALAARSCTVLDATCPNVAHIHDVVRQAEAAGRIPVVVGDAAHPEIVGIVGCTEGGALELVVADDGVGFEGQNGEITLPLDLPASGSRHNRVALNTVYQMLQHLYGPKYGIRITSFENSGTTVTILLPKEESHHVQNSDRGRRSADAQGTVHAD